MKRFASFTEEELEAKKQLLTPKSTKKADEFSAKLFPSWLDLDLSHFTTMTSVHTVLTRSGCCVDFLCWPFRTLFQTGYLLKFLTETVVICRRGGMLMFKNKASWVIIKFRWSLNVVSRVTCGVRKDMCSEEWCDWWMRNELPCVVVLLMQRPRFWLQKLFIFWLAGLDNLDI